MTTALLFFSLLWATLISQSVSQTCSSQIFTNNAVYAHCLDLPSLTSFLHFTYNSSNSTLSLAFTASPPSSGGWISWALNPSAPQMLGSEALVAFRNSSSSSVTVKFYNVSGYSSVVPTSKLSFDVWDARAEEVGSQLRIFAKIKVPEDMAVKGSVNQVWQVGPGVGDGGALTPHATSTANLAAKGTLDLNGGGSTTVSGGSRLKKKNVSYPLRDTPEPKSSNMLGRRLIP